MIGQSNNGSFNRPIMACTQILVPSWEPRTNNGIQPPSSSIYLTHYALFCWAKFNRLTGLLNWVHVVCPLVNFFTKRKQTNNRQSNCYITSFCYKSATTRQWRKRKKMIISTRSVLLKLWRYIGTWGEKDRVNLFSCRLNLSFVSIFLRLRCRRRSVGLCILLFHLLEYFTIFQNLK